MSALIDRQRIDAICGDDEALAISLVSMFIDEAEPIVKALDECAQWYDVTEMKELARSLGRIAASIGAFEMRDAAAHLEGTSAAKNTPTSSVLAGEVGAIMLALDRIRATRRAWRWRAAGHVGIFAA